MIVASQRASQYGDFLFFHRQGVVMRVRVFVSAAVLVFAIASDLKAEPADGTRSRKIVRLPPVISQGETGPLIFDLHATLNEVMSYQRVELPEGFSTDGSSITTPWGEVLRIPNKWRIITHIFVRPFIFSPQAPVQYFELPPTIVLPEAPIESFRIYGQQTYLLVMLFQIKQHLPATGEVDAVTLHHLRPLLPSSRQLLLSVMDTVSPNRQRPMPVPHNPRGVSSLEWAKIKIAAVAALLALLVCAVAFLVFRYAARIVDRVLTKRRMARDSGSGQSSFLAHLQRWRFFPRLSHLAPASLLYLCSLIYPDYWIHEFDPGPWWSYPFTFFFWNALFKRLGLTYITLSLMFVCLSVVRAAESCLTPDERTCALSGITRFARGTILVVAGLLIVAAVAGRSPLIIIGSLGVFMAIFVVLFRDSLLGLVASIQIVSNNIVNVGDWIEMPRYGADGDVQTITLNMITVQNFDHTISTIPTHAVLGESFRNWSGMRHAGARRIKRAIYIDMHTIRRCEDARYRHLLAEVSAAGAGTEGPAEGQIQFETNLAAYREYVVRYLRAAEHVHPREEMAFLVRHLQPTEKGLPLEIYAFCTRIDWIDYEAVLAELIEHLLARLGDFDLCVFQDRSDALRGHGHFDD